MERRVLQKGGWTINGAQTTDFVPIGAVFAWLSRNIPESYLLCDGSTINGDEYSRLREVLGSNRLPDLRGVFLRGYDNGRGIDIKANRTIGGLQYGTPIAMDVEKTTYPSAHKVVGNFGEEITRLTKDKIYDQAGMDSVHPDIIPHYEQLMYQWVGGTTVNYEPFRTAALTQYNQRYGHILGFSRPINVAVNYIIKAK